MALLSARQQQMIDFIREYHLDRSYMPAVRDIQAACGISSTSVVDYNMRILEREGYVKRFPDISRGLELVGEEHAAHGPRDRVHLYRMQGKDQCGHDGARNRQAETTAE